jgi:hypothetical protein
MKDACRQIFGITGVAGAVINIAVDPANIPFVEQAESFGIALYGLGERLIICEIWHVGFPTDRVC